jgi:hypothetical protein
MKGKIFILLLLCLFILTINNTQIFIVNAAASDPEFAESINVFVNCTTAMVSTQAMVMSSDTSFVRFPAGIDLSRTELESATTIMLSFLKTQSLLVCVFENIAPSSAQTIADSMKPSIENGFDTSFTWLSTGSSGNYVNVTYSRPGKTNLVGYTEWLMQRCLASDLGGFSLTFTTTMAQEPNAFVSVNAFKESGGFDWTYSMLTGYSTNIPTGTGNRKIDILNLLNVNSLSPSSYAESDGAYSSTVMLTIYSNETVSYVSCEPGEASSTQPRGWFKVPIPNQLMAYFNFGDDPSPVSPLSFTFGGKVVPEFTALALIATLILAATIILIIKRQLKFKITRHFSF